MDRATDTHAAQGSGEAAPRPIGERSPTSPSSRRSTATLSNSWVPTSPVPLGIVTKLPQRATNGECQSGRPRPFVYPNGVIATIQSKRRGQESGCSGLVALESPPLPASANAPFSCSSPSSGQYNPLLFQDSWEVATAWAKMKHYVVRLLFAVCRS